MNVTFALNLSMQSFSLFALLTSNMNAEGVSMQRETPVMDNV
jgi:hypothetical protein